MPTRNQANEEDFFNTDCRSCISLVCIITTFMNRISSLILLFLCCSSVLADKPNVILILGDDQAWSDYGFMGHPEIKTPHLDQLAQKSLLFSRAYVAAPLCRPSLASMLTGKYAKQHGVTGNDVDGNRDREKLDLPVRERFHQLPSFVRMLTSNGYLAHQSGKWWEGSHRDGGFTHGMMPSPARHGNATSLEIGRNGLRPITDFIDEATAQKKPFFVWYAPFLPHTPHTPPERLLKKYERSDRPPDVAKYYAMCEWFDETCGQLLGHLDQKNLTSNTIIVFLCDNGWAAASTNQTDPNQKQWNQYALRSKGSPYENGIRTPILISWPGTIKPAHIEDFAHSIDLFPTLASLVKLEAPRDLPGINLLDDTARKNRRAVFGETHSIHNMTPGNPDDTLQYLWCVTDEWKLIIRRQGKDTTQYRDVHLWDKSALHLYRIKDDPTEKNDLADQQHEVVKSLREKIETWHTSLR